MEINEALAAAMRVGEQLRVMQVNNIQHRHADECHAHHTKVWVKDGKVTKAE
jgi:hypothetical protein